MKRILITILTIAILAGTVFALTYDADYYAARKSWTGAQNNSLDPLYLFMNEVGLILHEEAGTIYYVDNNSGDDADDGLSWDKAFLTITYALAASHTNIATSPNYADRNIIYVRGDDFDEDLTDLAQKTDIIGVGSDDGNKMPRLLGNHTIDAVATGYNYMGCRFINMTFVNQTAADIFVVPTGHHGLEWINCRFESNSSTLAPSAIDITACSDTKIIGCDFISSTAVLWSGGAIDFGAGLAQNTHIIGNYIDADIGITIDASTTGYSCRIAGNTIHSTTYTIDDNSDVFMVTDNTLVSDGRRYQSIDFDMEHAARNILTHTGGTVSIPYDNTCAGKVAAAARGAHGKIYYCDANHGANTNDGLTWETPFLNMATALAAAHAHVASGGYACERVTVYYNGDNEESVDQTALAQKTDIVGVGANSGFTKGAITGTWIIPDSTSYMGCHFYNMQFTDAGAEPIFDIDTQGGLEFHNCLFMSSASTTIGLQVEETSWLKVDNCDFVRTNANRGFSASAIKIIDDTNSIYGVRISNNTIVTAGIGIDWDEAGSYDCWVSDNHIFATGLVIDDDGDNTHYINNRLVTAVNIDTYAEGTGWDFNPNLSLGNLIVGSSAEVADDIADNEAAND